MNGFFKLFLLVLILFIGTCSYCSATVICDACDYLTDEQSDEYIVEITLTDCGQNCTVSYTIEATKGYCEDTQLPIFHYEILRIDYSYPGKNACTCDLEDIVKLVQLDCIAKGDVFFNFNYPNAPDDPIWSETVGQVFFEFGVCWYYDSSSQFFHVPCPTTLLCCVEYGYDLKESECQITGSWDRANIPGTYTCPEYPENCEEYDCNDFVLGQDTYPFPKLVVEDSELPNETNFSSIKPNPVTNDYELYFTSEEQGMIEVSIVDNLGNIIYTFSVNKQNTEISVPLTSENLVSGVYFYRIIQSGKVLSDGSFTVVK